MCNHLFVKSVCLTNYRNYKSVQLNLGRRTTIITGKNGVGKTNMISAIKQSLSFIFSKEEDSPQFAFIASSEQKVKSFLSTDAYYENGDYIYPVSVGADMQLYDKKDVISWELCKPSADKGINESYVTSCVEFWTQVLNTEKVPVFAFFFGFLSSCSAYNWEENAG